MVLTKPIIAPPTNHQITLPDHTQLPDSDGTFVKNFQELPQSIILTTSIEPILQKLHPDGRYCIGQDSGIYWRITEPPIKGAEAPDWFYVPNVEPLLAGEYRRSYVMWKEIVAPFIAIEFVSGDGSEERDTTSLNDIDEQTGEPKKAGKFWVYERAIRIPFYAIYEVKKASVEVYHLVDGKYEKMPANERGHYPVPEMGVELGIQQNTEIPWLRWWTADGEMLLSGNERADQEQQRADQEQQRADQEQQRADQEQQRADQERIAKQQAEALLLEERQQNEKLTAYLKNLGINPDLIP
ncbi:Uma2 family endonuclease [Dolichospermum sp. LEGE 00240]|uniref:Uma2 family endonuclease n=1 Tax=Dolichospermum sp. LEGE 00240 TaxID=1828603 RepID=UPI00187FB1C6|nr:Uma2 family endonuclease [Dolichospermum sp. LEGE 00240]MBE9249618.1 Uma2 family endonuclease [Dolichospermum sp. LEGE 00240]MDM3853928.1 Uma2 family endonuclease [Aphanizomenon gracile PMC649.10]MDM3861454.1 Uma2 family endonuclease [Aphanizomenon gracile PMC644.10]